MEQQKKEGDMVWILIIVALIAGLGGGYFYGYSKGQGDIVEKQEAEKAVEKQAAQAEIAEKANPFSEAGDLNPLEGGYENPFKGATANPFRQ